MSSNNIIASQNQGSAVLPRTIPVNTIAFAPVKQSRKTLRFRPMATVRVVDCSKTVDEKSRSYYSLNEMKAMSLKVQKMCTSLKCREQAMVQDCAHGLDSDPTLRGLERYLCPNRARGKVLIQKALLKYHKYLNANPNMTSEGRIQSLASASAKLSAWSNKVALETARLDSLRALEVGDNMISGDNTISSIGPADALSLHASIKRTRDASDQDGQHLKKRRSQSTYIKM